MISCSSHGGAHAEDDCQTRLQSIAFSSFLFFSWFALEGPVLSCSVVGEGERMSGTQYLSTERASGYTNGLAKMVKLTVVPTRTLDHQMLSLLFMSWRSTVRLAVQHSAGFRTGDPLFPSP
jgi:hypothetical protein